VPKDPSPADSVIPSWLGEAGFLLGLRATVTLRAGSGGGAEPDLPLPEDSANADSVTPSWGEDGPLLVWVVDGLREAEAVGVRSGSGAEPDLFLPDDSPLGGLLG